MYHKAQNVWDFCIIFWLLQKRCQFLIKKWSKTLSQNIFLGLKSFSKLIRLKTKLYLVQSLSGRELFDHPPYIYIYIFRGNARILVLGGNIGQNFIHDFLSSSVLQWRRQNFGSGGHSAKLYSSKTFEKFRKIYKKFAQNLKILQNFSKIKFNRI